MRNRLKYRVISSVPNTDSASLTAMGLGGIFGVWLVAATWTTAPSALTLDVLDQWTDASASGGVTIADGIATLTTGSGDRPFSAVLVSGDDGGFNFPNPLTLPADARWLVLDTRYERQGEDAAEAGQDTLFTDYLTVVLYVADDPANKQLFAPGINATQGAGWQRSAFDLRPLAGRRVAISLELTDVDDGFDSQVAIRLSGVTAPHACSLDLDGNGEADPLSDAVLLMRHLGGISGGELVQGALATDATTLAEWEIAGQIEQCAAQGDYDIDGDGTTSIATDGVLINRYLFGFSGADLTENAVGESATRTATQIQAHLADLVAR